MTAAKQQKKLIAVFDPQDRPRELLGQFLDGMGYQVELHGSSRKIAESAAAQGADLVVINLAVFGADYSTVVSELKKLDLSGGKSRPIVAVTSLKLSREARARIEQLGASIVLDQQAPFMELVFSINSLLFPKIRELRHYTRVFGGFPIQYKQQDDWQDGKVYNISREGAFIQCDDPPPENARIEVRFVLPGREDRTRVAANVNWVNSPETETDSLAPSGMGVRFLVLNREESTSLEQFISERVNGTDPSGGSSPS